MATAAFFDLDKTLMEGSSAIHFGRAAYRRGLVTRRQLAKDLWANVRFRLRGATDEETDVLRQRILDSIAGRSVVDLARLSPEMLAGILPRVYPEMLEVAWRHQDEGRRIYIVTAASQELADMLARVLPFDRLRRRLRIAAAAGAVAAVAAAAGRISVRLRPDPRAKRVRRLLPG